MMFYLRSEVSQHALTGDAFKTLLRTLDPCFPPPGPTHFIDKLKKYYLQAVAVVRLGWSSMIFFFFFFFFCSPLFHSVES